VSVLRSLLQDGEVSFRGDHFDVEARIGRRCAIPVMVGALQPRTFEMAGALADGAITWLCPAKYLADEAIPRLETAASAAGRDRPVVIAHIAACVHEDPDEVRAAVREGIPNVRFPGYQRMLVTAGFPEASDGRWTDELIDGVIAWGPVDHVASRITDLFEAGADEVLVRPIGAGSDGDKVTAITLEAISAAFQS
jgi:alkanesulfonate monooxygenase SsuD/methylene tetrahydromethanopterin reductase-like flavin-dependent oxidoreductase (luciferase family)